jgi:arylsulfatase A-like enzyme
LGHVDGGDLDQEALTADMQGFDQDLGRLEQAYRQAGILDQTLFIVTADHGMMPITRFIPSSVVTDAIAHAGTTSPDIASNSADYVWLADPTKAQTVAQNVLAAHDPGIASAYFLSNDGGHAHYEAAAGSNITPDEDAANQYLLSALLNGREPAVVVFGNEGASFSDPKSNWKADHGGNTWQSQHIPLVLSGPGVRQGAVATSPAQLEDVAPTALALMGVEPTGMEGRVLTDALTQPTPSSRDARALELNEIDPVVSALRAEEGQGQGQA